MGNAVSSSSALPPISFASTILSFITFTTTFLTFVYTFWSDARTAYRADEEVHSILGGLGIALHEERSILRKLRKRYSRRGKERATMKRFGTEEDKGELSRRSSRVAREREEEEEEAVWRSLEVSVRRMCRSWEDLERHFRPSAPLENDSDVFQATGSRHRRRVSGGEMEKGREEVETQVENRTRYASMSIARRWLWVRQKNAVVRLSEGLSRVQTRRIGRQVADASVMAERIMDVVLDIGDRVEDMEARLNRVVGVRKVD